MKHRLLAVILLALIALAPLDAAAQARRLKVMVLPFDVHSPVDVSAERRALMDALAGGIEAAGAEITGIEEIKAEVRGKGAAAFTAEDAARLAASAPSDFAVLGSITRAGSATSVDLRVLDLKTGESLSFHHRSSLSVADLMAKLRETAAEMAAGMAAAQAARPAVKGGTVSRIDVAGARRVDQLAVRKKLASREGEPYSPDDVRDDIRAIYSTGFFDDVSASLTETASGKVLTFTVRETPFIKKIVFSGNKELKEDRLREAVTLKENKALDRTALADSAAKIREKYAEEGHYLAGVDPVVESDGLEAVVTFRIDEGPEVRVKRITVIGADRYGARKIKGLMSTDEAGYFSFISGSGKFNEAVFMNDLAVILGFYYDRGHINADILEHTVLLSEDKRYFYITIALTEGDPYTVGSVDVSGELLTSKEELMDKLKTAPGDVFNRTRLTRDIDAITDVYGEKGYANVDVRPATKADPAKKTMDIVFEIKKNEMVYVERIDISGNTRTRDKVIRRELELEEGSLFSTTELKKSKGNLRRLGYFEDVKITQSPGSTSDRVKLNVGVKERPTGSISLGIGYSSVDKAIMTASVAQSNFMGTGIKLDASATVSSTSSRYVLGVTEPWLFDKPVSAGFDVYNTEKSYTDFKMHKIGFDLRAGFPITKRYTRGYLTYKTEQVDITDVLPTAAAYIKEQAGGSTERSIRASIRRDTRDDAFFPTEGSVQQLSTEYAGGFLGGTNYYIKYEADAVKYFSLPWDTTFSARGAAGYVQDYGGRKVPVYERYFLGGINSVRGFKTRSLSPEDPVTKDLIGGDTMLLMNLEWVFPIAPEQHLRGVVFFDAGNAFLGAPEADGFRRGAGVGVRWFSPIGPLRLELGFPLDRRPDEPSSQWDFTIGGVF